MSSNIRVTRICKCCGREFEARTTVTKFCGHACASRAYKAVLSKQRLEKSDKETKSIRENSLEELKTKEFLTVRDAAMLLNSSRQTIYNLINSGIIYAVNIKVKKTLIRRSEIDNLFNLQEIVPIQKAKPKARRFKDVDFYSMGEMQTKFGISESGLYHLINRNNIPKFQKGNYVYVSKKIMDELLAVKK
jgi:excisionase family DNA binding protein